jgi:SAM-dependent methyltransferase
MTWDAGDYEQVAVQLLPVAETAVGRLAPDPGEIVVDVGCGVGNAALLAAARGAEVLGIDPAPRLLDVARRSATARGLEATFHLGEAESLPVPDSAADAIVSVFGVIFAPDAYAAAAEMDRVLGPNGRFVVAAWMPSGAVAEQARLRREAVAEAQGSGTGPAPFAWHDADALIGLFDRYGFELTVEGEELAFTGASPRDYCNKEFRHHPMWVEARSVLEPVGQWQELKESVTQAFVEANEDPRRFRVTSPFALVSGSRGTGTVE